MKHDESQPVTALKPGAFAGSSIDSDKKAKFKYPPDVEVSTTQTFWEFSLQETEVHL